MVFVSNPKHESADMNDMSFFARIFRKGGGGNRGHGTKRDSPSPDRLVPPGDYTPPSRLVRRSVSAPMALVSDRRCSVVSDRRDGFGRRPGSALSNMAAPSCQALEGYVCVSQLHRGRLTTVFKAQDSHTNQWVAVKVFATPGLPPSMVEQVRTEMNIMQRVSQHGGVPSLLKHAEDGSTMYMISEYCSGGTLLDLMGHLRGHIPEAMAIDLASATLSTLEYLHQNGIVHRNIKPEHLLRGDGGQWKLIDFGSAAERGVHFLNARVGSLQYMAPEVLAKPSAEEVFHEVIDKGLSEDDLVAYNEKADLWSLGVTLFEALTGRQPFLAETPAEMLHKIHDGYKCTSPSSLPPFLADTHISANAKDFIHRLLTLHPDSRAAARELRGHPWLHAQYSISANASSGTTLPSRRSLVLNSGWDGSKGGAALQFNRPLRTSLQEIVAG